MTNTLKRLLENNQSSDENWNSIISADNCIKMVREWLMQKRQEVQNRKYTFEIQKSSRLVLLSELLEELRPKEGTNK